MIGLLGEAALDGAVERVTAALRPTGSIRGWATVDLDRVPPGPGGSVRAVPDDVLLGARGRLVCEADGRLRLALEPATEGRLAASLARYGEGAVALYLRVDAAVPGDSFPVSDEADGPFGRQRLLLVGPRWGPHLIAVTRATIWP